MFYNILYLIVTLNKFDVLTHIKIYCYTSVSYTHLDVYKRQVVESEPPEALSGDDVVAESLFFIDKRTMNLSILIK